MVIILIFDATEQATPTISTQQRMAACNQRVFAEIAPDSHTADALREIFWNTTCDIIDVENDHPEIFTSDASKQLLITISKPGFSSPALDPTINTSTLCDVVHQEIAAIPEARYLLSGHLPLYLQIAQRGREIYADNDLDPNRFLYEGTYRTAFLLQLAAQGVVEPPAELPLITDRRYCY